MNKIVRRVSLVSASEKSTRPRKKLRPSASVDTLAILTETGISKFRSGLYDEAEKCFSQALCRIDVKYLCDSVQTAICGFSSEGLGAISLSSSKRMTGTCEISKSNLYIYQRHEYDEGMHAYDVPLSIQESSNVDSITSTLLYNIAQTFVRRGRCEVAITWFERALAKRNNVDTETPDFLVKVLHNLGHCCYRVGRNPEAMIHYQQALSLISKFGLGDIEVAAVLNCIGVLHFHRHSDDAQKALEMLHQSLAIYRSRLGSLSKQVATVLNNMGRVHYLLSEYERALQVYDEALRIRQQVLGADSIDVAATIYNTGQTLHQLGRLDECMGFYEDFLTVAKRRLGSESRDVANVYRCVAEVHQERGDLKLALQCFLKSLKAGRASLGNNHPDVASTLNKLGNLCYEMQDHNAAMEYYKEGLEIEFKVLIPNHPHIIITMTNIAHLYKSRSDYAGALRTYLEVRIMQEKAFGPNSLEVAATFSSMGLMQYHMKCYGAAFDSYQEALRIRRDYFGCDEHPDIASTLNSIGLVLFKQDIFELAKNCFEESLRIRKKILGPDHRDVAILWYNIATIYFETGEDEIAIKLYKETLRVERASLGKEHPDVVLTLQHMGQVMHQVGDLQHALEYFREALEIERRREDGDMSVAKILNLMGNIHLQQGHVCQMMDCYSEASRIYERQQHSTETLVVAGYNFYGLSKLHPACAPVA